MEQLAAQINTLNSLLVTLCDRVGKIEKRQEVILKAIGKLPTKRSHAPKSTQNLGCVRTGKHFEAITLHEKRVCQIETHDVATFTNDIAEHYCAFVQKFLRTPKNQSFYRQCKQHNYVHTTRGWEKVRASYLVSRLERITRNAFAKYVKEIRPEVDNKVFNFKIPKKKFLSQLDFCKEMLRKSKNPTDKPEHPADA